jgi:hypothetical protein
MYIRYLVSFIQVLKDTSFGLDNWCKCEKKIPIRSVLWDEDIEVENHLEKFDSFVMPAVLSTVR